MQGRDIWNAADAHDIIEWRRYPLMVTDENKVGDIFSCIMVVFLGGHRSSEGPCAQCAGLRPL